MPAVWIDLTMKNGGSHFSQETNGALLINVILFFATIILLGRSMYAYFMEIKKEHNWDHPLVFMILVCMLEFFSICFHLIHLFTFSYDGEGILVMDVLKTILQVLA